jgi:hypothetical protein
MFHRLPVLSVTISLLLIFSTTIQAAPPGGSGAGDESDYTAYIAIGVAVAISAFLVMDIISDSRDDTDGDIDLQEEPVLVTDIDWEMVAQQALQSAPVLIVLVFPIDNGSELAELFLQTLTSEGPGIFNYPEQVISLGTIPPADAVQLAEDYFEAQYIVIGTGFPDGYLELVLYSTDASILWSDSISSPDRENIQVSAIRMLSEIPSRL